MCFFGPDADSKLGEVPKGRATRRVTAVRGLAVPFPERHGRNALETGENARS